MLPSVRSENPSDNAHLYRLKTKGSFQIWSKETLIKHGFNPETSPYYAVFLFDNTNEIIFPKIDIKNGAVLTGSSTYLKLLIIHLINPRLGSKVYVCKYSLFICEKYKTFIL